MRRFLQDSLNRSWLILIGLTLLTTAIAESGTLTTAAILLIAAIVVVKGRLIIREYMDMKTANRWLYWALMAYMVLFSAAMVVFAVRNVFSDP